MIGQCDGKAVSAGKQDIATGCGDGATVFDDWSN